MSRIPTPALESATGADIGSRDAESALVNRHAKRNPYSVLLRIVRELVCHAFIISLYLVLSVLSAFEPAREQHAGAVEPPAQAASRIPSAMAVRRIW